MFFPQYFLHQFQIDDIVKEATEGLKDDVKNQAFEKIISCFLGWQIAHGVKPKFNGLLSSVLHQDNQDEKLTKDDINKLEPWKCAGFSVNNPIDLGFKLWLDNYQPFDVLKKEYGLHIIFAVLLTMTNTVEHSNSIFRAYSYILHYRQWLLEGEYELLLEKAEGKKLKHRQQITEARQIANYNKTAKSNEYKRLWNRWALEAKKANPLWLKKQVVEYVRQVAEKQNHRMANGKTYSATTIDKFITLENLKILAV